MDLKRLTTRALGLLQDAVRRALIDDDANSLGKRYLVREEWDWRYWSDRLEAELDRRGVKFVRVPW